MLFSCPWIFLLYHYPSAFTVTLSCVSTFFTAMFSYTFLNILNVLLTFLCLFFFFAVLFRVSVHTLLCYAFLSMEHTTIFQFHHSFFFPILYSGHKIFLFSCSNTLPPITSFLPHSIYCTLIISLLLTSLFLQFYAS